MLCRMNVLMLAILATGILADSDRAESDLLKPLHENCTQNFVELLLLRQEMRLTDILSESRATHRTLKTISENLVTAQGRTQCDHGFTPVGSKCLNLVQKSMSWSEAREQCAVWGADLATLKDANEFALILKFIKDSPQSVWLGGTDEENEGQWKWLSGGVMPMGPPFWGSYCETGNCIHEPAGGTRENCAILFNEDRFYVHDTPCFASAMSLCELP